MACRSFKQYFSCSRLANLRRNGFRHRIPQLMFSSDAPSGSRPLSACGLPEVKSDVNAAEPEAISLPLSKPLPGIATPKYAKADAAYYTTKVTTLENGLRVASEPKFGQFCTIGVLIDSGSRYEGPYPSGITHFLEKLAFGKTSQFANRDAILQTLEKHGGICDCQGSRDTLIYALSVNNENLHEIVELLSEVVLRPAVTPNEVDDARTTIQYELEALSMNPNPDPLLFEMIHAAAYRDNTLGLPKICPQESLSQVDDKVIRNYLHHCHTPDRMVLAGVGMDHDVLVDLAKRHFLNKKPSWEEYSNFDSDGKKGGKDLSISQYTGGTILVEKDLSNVSLGPNPMPELAHVVIGLESCSHKDPDFIAFCVLNMLMGGGGSFSAGGPGKGMYTRLYLNVLNRYHWIHNATAYNHAYNDSGTFCIHGSSHPTQLKELVEVIVREMVNTQHTIHDEELDRAKTQLQSMLLMNLEARPVIFEDIGRQVLSNRQRLPATHYYDEIGKITDKDIKRVSQRMLSSPPAVAALGSLARLPSYTDIAKALASKDGRMSKKFVLF